MRTTTVKVRQLEVFVALVDRGTVTRAAEALALSQPAVSMALGELEQRLGQLFDRERGRLRLNARGRECLPNAREILLRLDDLARPEEEARLTGQLRLGTSNSVGNYRVGELLGTFVRQQPGVTLQVTVGNTHAIVDSLLTHRIDLGCVEGAVHHPRIQVLPWCEDVLAVCAAPSHPLSSKTVLRPADFANVDWILREPGSATRRFSENVLMGLPPGRIVLELGQTEGIKQAVMAGLGIACLPLAATQDVVETGRLCVLPTPFLSLSRWLSLILPQDAYRGSLVDAFMASLRGGQP